MKKLIISALLAGTTALAASSALALDPCKYSAGVALGWGVQNKTTYTTNLSSTNATGALGTLTSGSEDMTGNEYITQKSFPNIDLRLGYNVNSFLQLGINALYTHKMESSIESFSISSLGVDTIGTTNPAILSMKTQENIFDLMVRAHIYSPESSMGTALFTGPTAGWESSKLKLAVKSGTTPSTFADADLQEAKDRKNTAILGWDMGIAQTVSRSGTSIELMGSILADMKKEYQASDFSGNPLPTGAYLTQKTRPLARLSLAVKQSF